MRFKCYKKNSMATQYIWLCYCNSSKLWDSPNGLLSEVHHNCRKYKVHSNILCLSIWMDLKCSTLNLLSLWILSTTRCTVFFCLFLYFLYFIPGIGYLFVYWSIYLYYVCVSWLSFCLSFSLSGLLAYVCCACHSPAQQHGIVLLSTRYNVAACVVVLWPQSLYLLDESPRTQVCWMSTSTHDMCIERTKHAYTLDTAGTTYADQQPSRQVEREKDKRKTKKENKLKKETSKKKETSYLSTAQNSPSRT